MKLIEYVKQRGRQRQLAQTLGITPVLISQWARGARPIPLDRCVDIECATQKAVTCEELRPDKSAYWSYLRPYPVLPHPDILLPKETA
jgi:DNA-binding transcriptional regulator YdaS (Cro superfamily)